MMRILANQCGLTPLVAVLMLILLYGCSSPLISTPSPTRVEITVDVSKDANPDPKGRDLPIVVRLFQVSAPSEFAQSDFFDLFDGKPSLAGNGYQLLDELEMAAGESRTTLHELQALAGSIGVVAGYRQIDKAQWLGVTAVENGADNVINVAVQRLEVRVTNTNKN